MSRQFSTLRVDRSNPQITVAFLNRPDRLNAISFEMFDELVQLQSDVDTDPDARVLILTGEGRAFCAGLDLDDAGTLAAMPAAKMLVEQAGWADSVSGFTRMATPVIAVVNGAAAGAGMGIALACDIRVASQEARFNAAFVRIGLSGGDVGTSWALPRLVGMGMAMEILLTGRFVGAAEAADIGLVSRVLPDASQAMAAAFEIAEQICANSPVGMALTKQVVHTNVDAPSLEAALAVENRNQVLATRTSDMSEALAAFREKRAPRFTGR